MDQNQPHNQEEIAFNLDAERRREIDGIRTRMEDFLKDQLKIDHKVDLVLTEQRLLKERFETVRKIDEKLDMFMIEWSQKKQEDKMRDERIDIVNKRIDRTSSNLDWLSRALIVSVCSGVFLGIIMWALQKFYG